MPSSRVTSKGRITIPIEMRRTLNLTAGSRVEFVELPDGTYELIPARRSVLELKGIVKFSGPPMSIEELDDAVGAGVAD
ncbi:MAG: AbrB family transcriptional regulator, partial [Aeromicrobium sp.]|nr:AbrB family transcriptional regulator [Aeromicrobium sp.]